MWPGGIEVGTGGAAGALRVEGVDSPGKGALEGLPWRVLWTFLLGALPMGELSVRGKLILGQGDRAQLSKISPLNHEKYLTNDQGLAAKKGYDARSSWDQA